MSQDKPGAAAEGRFVPRSDDPLYAEHELVSQALEEACGTGRYEIPPLRTFPSGLAILKAKPAQARRLLLAALVQMHHWGQRAAALHIECKGQPQDIAARSGRWLQATTKSRVAREIFSTLIARALSLEQTDLIAILTACCLSEETLPDFWPCAAMVRALQRFAKDGEISAQLDEAMERFVAWLRDNSRTPDKRLAIMVERLRRPAIPQDEAEAATTRIPTPSPEAAGHPSVLYSLKQALGIVEADRSLGDKGSPEGDSAALPSSPLQEEHALLGEILSEPEPGSPPWQRFAALDEMARGRVVLAAAEQAIASLLEPSPDAVPLWQNWPASTGVLRILGRCGFELDRAGLFDFLLFLSSQNVRVQRWFDDWPKLLAAMQSAARSGPLSAGERYVLHLWRASRIEYPPFGIAPRGIRELTALIGDGQQFFLVPGECWSDALNDDLTRCPADVREAWSRLLEHCYKANTARPSAKWQKTAEGLVNTIGQRAVRAAFGRWLPAVPQGRSLIRIQDSLWDTPTPNEVVNRENASCLRGMLWIAPTLESDAELVRLLTKIALSSYKKVPGIGPRAVKVGHAAIYALSLIGSRDSLGQLTLLKARVKFRPAQKEIEKAFTVVAQRLSLPRDEVEELGVPTYGLQEVGRVRRTFGGHTADLVVCGSSAAAIRWSRPDGRPVKSTPATVKKEYAEELKELAQAARDISKMLMAQRARLDALHLARKSWSFPLWRVRYLDHPLVGVLARRLIWTFARNRSVCEGIFCDGRLVDVDGRTLEPRDETQVALWHPLGRNVDEVVRWRDFLERHEVQQPIKQAHREIYLLTDAERETRIYSNRFAGHILRQHQFNALCAVRGWRNQLRLLVDQQFPPAMLLLPAWNLRAEFSVEGVGDDWCVDTNESGVFHRISTDQVRFYSMADGTPAGRNTPRGTAVGDAIPLDQLPPLVLSEVLRDVDLFVGVASVGNDPTWSDGGPDRRFGDYWQTYAFGALSETAKTRKAALERIIPRLAIAERCSLTDRFLIVRGDLRTYKIHLGSSNILMDPGDRYLCIVPAQCASSVAASAKIFLPFEGDERLSIIMSKALMLAADREITDPTITMQIGR